MLAQDICLPASKPHAHLHPTPASHFLVPPRSQVAGFDPSCIPTVFTTRNQAQMTDRHFLDSASKISCFLEEKAVGPDGQLTQPMHRAINKIGHGATATAPSWSMGLDCWQRWGCPARPGAGCLAGSLRCPPSCVPSPPAHHPSPPSAALHDLDPVFRRWSRSEKMAELAVALGFRTPLPVQVLPPTPPTLPRCCTSA